MELTNKVYKHKDSHPEDKDALRIVFSFLTKAMYPYCPHLASEVWASCFAGEITEGHSDYQALKQQISIGVTVTV